MKSLPVLCAAVCIVAGSYTPAQAISVDEPGYYNKCQAAYVHDPVTYERDCENSMDSLTKGKNEPAPVVVCVTDLGPVILMMTPGERVRTASLDPCHLPPP